ncbi:hypothetical protein GQ43DRAFT_426241 [Delitschia confertaspora ATCC 74209]|uniref:AAA+ ATPase domain-containing protein n=1 Tax=Delitschia confertaspora ATCC 74209 TaxID=1513339 RepID=A0A9P4JBU7_9PLEO|nr:hypothetical protein GQ43DRAFT_426241 [Delitschia confertaspora ATCC 74209]
MPPNASTNLTITNPLVLYRSLVATKRIRPDPAQHRLALHLQKLYEELKDYEPTIEYRHKLHQISRAIGPARPLQNDTNINSQTEGVLTDRSNHPHGPSNPSIWSSLFQRKQTRDSLALTRTLTSRDAALSMQSPKGLMLHGEVGTGKSMLVDLFADCLPNRKKRRWHFNTFMLDTISRLEALRMERSLTVSRTPTMSASALDEEYPLLTLARDLIEKSPILFLDEFQFPDRAASKILSNLLTAFFQLGGVLVATSNRMPEELAKAAGMEFQRRGPGMRGFGRFGWGAWGEGMGGLGISDGWRDTGSGQRGEFAMFLEVVKGRCEVWEMEGRRDYRRLEEGRGAASWWEAKGIMKVVRVAESTVEGVATTKKDTKSESTTLPETTTTIRKLPKYYLVDPFRKELDTILHTATSTPPNTPIPWSSPPNPPKIYGRPLFVPAQHNGVLLFTFNQLCGSEHPLGPADYITLASTYHTLVIIEVPKLTLSMRNEVRRFVTCLDAVYEARGRLLIVTFDDVGPDELFFAEALNPSSSSAGSALGASSPSSSPYPTDELRVRNAVETAEFDPTHAETFSEIHQDLTSPFRPNISSYTSSALSPDALEDNPPTRFRHKGSNLTDERSGGGGKVDFTKVTGLTGEDERFAVKRARSRVWEMCSGRWWEGRGLGDEREGVLKPKWWRPLPRELRHWEGPVSLPRSNTKSSSQPVLQNAKFSIGSPKSAQSDTNTAESGSSDMYPSQTNPPKISLMHIWGTTKWGRRAGTWGKGVEGLEDRKRKKQDQNSGEVKKKRDGE